MNAHDVFLCHDPSSHRGPGVHRLHLPQDQRAHLAASPLTSLPAVLDEEDEGFEEATRRSRELDEDPALACSWDDINRNLRADSRARERPEPKAWFN